MIYPPINPKFNKICRMCEHYPPTLDHDLDRLPYHGRPNWMSRILVENKIVYEDTGVLKTTSGKILPLTEDHTLLIFGDKYVAFYQWVTGKWVLYKKEGRIK